MKRSERDSVIYEFDWGGAPYTRFADPFVPAAIESMADTIIALRAELSTARAHRDRERHARLALMNALEDLRDHAGSSKVQADAALEKAIHILDVGLTVAP